MVNTFELILRALVGLLRSRAALQAEVRQVPAHGKPKELASTMAQDDKRKQAAESPVGTTQRSIAAMAFAWLRRNVSQVCDGGL